MLRVLVVALVLLVAAMFMLPRPSGVLRRPETATLVADAATLPPFSLSDTARAPLSNDALKGRFSLLFFGYTNCPDVCPLTLQALASMKRALEKREPKLAPEALPQVLFVSVDSERDTPARMRSYLDGFDASFLGATGPDAALAPLFDTLGVTARKEVRDGTQYEVAHNGAIYFIGPRAELIAVSSPPHDPATLASDYVKISALYAGGGP
jgi:protein SCO1/2